MKWISLGRMLCLLQLVNAVCECGDDQQSFIPSLFNIHPPSPFNGTDGSPSSFGSTCVLSSSLYDCTNNTDNPLFDCSTSNNSYYGWDIQSQSPISVSVEFSNHFQSMNILVTFLISTSSNVSAPSLLQYAPFQPGVILSTSTDYIPNNLPEGPYQHNLTVSSDMMFNGVVIAIMPDTTFQWVAINRIIFCAAATEDQTSSSTNLMSPSSSMLTPAPMATASSTVSTIMSLTTTESVTMSSAVSSSASVIVRSTVATTDVPSSDNDDDSVSVAVISGTAVGTLLLIIIIIIIVLVMIILCSRRRKKSSAHNIDDKVKLSSHVPNPQQHAHGTLEHNHTNSGTSKLEMVNTLYIPTTVKSVDSSLQHDDIIITPNPSYTVGPNSSETGKECEYQYDYVQIGDGSVQHDKIVGAITSGGEYDKVIDPADNVNIDPNPSYLLPQDVKLEDNPSYTQLLASS